jgi:hypothetical protein
MSYVSPFTGDVVQPTDVSFRAVTLSANTQLQWPINGNTSTDYAARIMDVTATAGGLSIYMPPANQTSVGNDALIRNLGSSAFTVKNYTGAGTITSVGVGEAKYIYVTTNANAQGTWSTIAFGTGTSSADAATLAGYGLVASGATLNQSHPSAAITTGSTFAGTDRSQTRVWSSGAGTATLPAAATLGNNWFTLFKNNGSGSFIISCTGAELIDGNSSKTFNPSESAIIVCTGTGYVTIGYGVSSNFVFTALVKSVVAGSYTLTASEASCTIQEYAGNLTGNVTAIYPPVVNFYVVSNQVTDNGFGLTITTGLGGFNVVIPPGQQVTLICDGVNFLSANTVQAGATSISLVDGSVSAPSMNFAAETNMGIYRASSGHIGMAVGATKIVDVASTGVTVTGTGTFSSGIAGGVFT